MPRVFRLITSRDNEGNGDIVAYGVTDITDEEVERELRLSRRRDSINEKAKYLHQEEVRGRVATFQVSSLHGREEQEQRAQALCDYMNRVQQSYDQALAQNSLLSVLTSKDAKYKKDAEDEEDVL